VTKKHIPWEAGDTAFEEGRNAALEGHAMEAGSYEHPSYRHSAWQAGWHKGHAELIAQTLYEGPSYAEIEPNEHGQICSSVIPGELLGRGLREFLTPQMDGCKIHVVFESGQR